MSYDFYMTENSEKNIVLLGEIKLTIKLCYTNDDPMEDGNVDFEADIYLETTENTYIHKSFTKIDDFSDYLYSQSCDDDGEETAKTKEIDKVLAEIQGEFEYFCSEARSGYRQDIYNEECRQDRADLEREYWATR